MYALAGIGRAGQGEFQHLYHDGARRPAAIHVGMSPDCRKLGLGAREISIAAGTGTDVMAGGAGAGPTCPPGYPELYLYMSVKTYIIWDIPT